MLHCLETLTTTIITIIILCFPSVEALLVSEMLYVAAGEMRWWWWWGGGTAGQASAGTAVAETHYCSSTASEKKRAAPATWPPCHAYTPSPATHTKRPGGARRQLALQSRVAVAGEPSGEVVWVWSRGRVEAEVRDRMGGCRG